MWHEERLLIDGELVPAEGGRTFETINPATGEVLGTAADASLADAQRAIKGARRAFDTTTWATDHAFRAHCLRQLHEALVRHTEDLRAVIVADVGAPLTLTQGPQLETPINIVRWYTELLEKFEWSEDLGTAEAYGATHHRWVEKEPVGVVAAIVPYNYPLQITLAKLVPALAAGCTVVVKGAPDTPWATQTFARILAEETDIPAGVVSAITSSSVDVAAALTTDPMVDMVSFTGSTATGRQIMAAASDTVKKVFLELGGKSAFIALDDCDLALAGMIEGFSICSHAGQGCAITTRMLVPQTMFDDAVDQLRTTVEGVAVGDPADPSTMMGPLINARQWDKVDGYVQRAVSDGAKVVTGGRRPENLPNGFFYEPTVLVNVDPDSAIAQEEVFGPVAVVLPYQDVDDAVAIANNSMFGLSAMVLGADHDRALSVARRLRTGTVSVNGGLWYGPDSPFGGYKQSGIGREMGEPGLVEYLELKTLAEPVT
jgi:acyl-CoA reductase-like NAD-dependent aldehyde dehydrogenase